MKQRTCTIDGCGRPHRARGYCASHYNQRCLAPDVRHATHIVACVICGTAVKRRVHTEHAPTCSVDCRSIRQWGQRQAQESHYVWRNDAEKRARDAGADRIDTFDRATVFARDGWACQQCGITCSEPNPYDPTAATVDHIVPLSKGGDHTLANVQTCCLSCNSSKQATLPEAA